MDYMYKERKLKKYDEAVINEYRRFIMMKNIYIKKATLNIGGTYHTIHLANDHLIVHTTKEEWGNFLYAIRFLLGIKPIDIVLTQNTFDDLLVLSSEFIERDISFRLRGMQEGLREETLSLRKQAIEDIKIAFRGKVESDNIILHHDKALLFIKITTEISTQERLFITSEESLWNYNDQEVPILTIILNYEGQDANYFKKQLRARMKAMFALKNNQYITVVTK